MFLGQNQHGKDVAISYAGRGLNSAEKSYSVTERKALSVVEAVKYFQTYLYGKRFVVYTDHHALRWLLRLKDPLPAGVSCYDSTILRLNTVLTLPTETRTPYHEDHTTPPSLPSANRRSRGEKR